VVWLDASDADTLWADTAGTIAATNAVARWDDKSGNTNNQLQSAANDRPTTDARLVYGLNAMDFDGGSDKMQEAANAFGSVISNVSLFVVMQADIMDQEYSAILDLSGNSTMGFYERDKYCFEVNNQRNFDGWCEWGDSSGDTGSTVLHSILYGGTTEDRFEAWVDGSLIRSHGSYDANPNQTTSSGIRLGVNEGNAYDGLFCEIVIVDGLVTQVEQEEFEGYLAWKWGLEGSLPADHTYKDEPPAGPAPAGAVFKFR
jgi:hypothetical protein